jgi:hypothetical protein
MVWTLARPARIPGNLDPVEEKISFVGDGVESLLYLDTVTASELDSHRPGCRDPCEAQLKGAVIRHQSSQRG